jgi:hypothetical protein
VAVTFKPGDTVALPSDLTEALTVEGVQGSAVNLVWMRNGLLVRERAPADALVQWSKPTSFGYWWMLMMGFACGLFVACLGLGVFHR